MELRKGATDLGRSYEYKMAALLATKLTLDSTVANFRMVSNIKGVGDFDDIVIEIKNHNGLMNVYCIQLKHKKNSNLQISVFENDLLKYEESYMQIKDNINKIDIFQNVDLQHVHFIYYTNAPLTRQKDNSILVKSIDCTNFLRTSTIEGTIFEVSNLPTSSKPFDKNFLSQFYLFTNQAKAPKLDELIKDVLCQKFRNNSNTFVDSLVRFFTEWSLDKSSIIISKEIMEERLLELILLPYMIDPGIGTYLNKDALDTLRETLLSFNVTNISQPGHLDNIFAMIRRTLKVTCGIGLDDSLSWNDKLSQNQLDTIYKRNSNKDKDLIGSNLQKRQKFQPLSDLRDLYFSAWSARIIPMILDCRSAPGAVVEVLTAFESVSRVRCFVLLGSLPNRIASLYTFENLYSLNDEQLFDKNLDTLSVSLQGKPYISLKWLSSKREIFRAMKPDAYLSLLMTPPSVGLKTDVVDYYIERKLIQPTLDALILDEAKYWKNTDLFIVIIEEGKLPLWLYNAMDLETSLKNPVLKEDIYIFTVGEDITELTKKARHLHDSTKKNVHILQYYSKLEWIHSEGSIDVLLKYVLNFLNSSKASEDILVYDNISNPKIICCTAGMGKTSLLKSVAGKFDENEWVSYVNLNDHASQIVSFESKDEILEYLLRQQIKNCEECLKDVVYNIGHSLISRTTWLFDGYDEVASPKLLSFLKYMKRMKFWITTRPTFKNDLEKNLGSLSYELTCFSSRENNNFLQKYFENHHIFKYERTQIDSIVRSIEKCSSSLDESFVGIPLQTKMFAEVFGYNPDQCNDERRLTIAKLYKKFIDIKLKEYKPYEATSLKKTLSKLALMVFYTKDTLKHLIDFEDLKEDSEAFKQTYKKDSVVAGINDNGDVLFGHRTFAEFLAAQWMTKKIVDKESPDNLDNNWLPLVKLLFLQEMEPVRLFFDRIVSEGLLLHSAVLENDMEKTVELLSSNDGVLDLDILGRSALQIAVSYGKFFDFYTVTDVHEIEDIIFHSEIIKPKVSLDIIEKLIDYGFPNTKDLLGYDLFDSAMRTCSLEVLNSLCRKFRMVELVFEVEYSFEVFVHLVVHKNYHYILSKSLYNDFSELSVTDNLKIRGIFLENKELLQLKYNGEYLTDIAARVGNKEILFILLSTGILSIDEGFPLHFACLNGHSEIVRMLCKMGADIEKEGIEVNHSEKRQNQLGVLPARPEDSTLTPLHFACRDGNLDSVEALLEMGADVKKIDGSGYSPLEYAATHRNANVIEILLEKRKADIPVELIQKACSRASSYNNEDCVRILLDFVDVNAIDEDGSTFLMSACKGGSLDVIQELTSNKNCDFNLLNSQENFQEVLRWAQRNNHSLLSAKLVALRPNPSISGRGGVGALHYAVQHGHAECVEALLDSGADKHLKDEIEGFCYTPLVWASLYGQGNITQILASRTYGTEHAHEVELALTWASILGYRDCVKHLLDLEPIVQGNIGVSEQVEAIISAEFGLDARNIDLRGNTPMLLAGKNCQLEVIQELFGKKYKDNMGLNDALYLASRHCGVTPETIDLLISNNCNITSKNDKGKTALDIALENQNFSFARKILMATRGTEFEIDKESLTYKNLQKVLKWAEDEHDSELIYRCLLQLHPKSNNAVALRIHWGIWPRSTYFLFD